MPTLTEVIRRHKKTKPANGKKAPPPPPAADPAQAVDGEAQPFALDVDTDEPFPADPRPEAFAGPLGELIDAIDPHTEASRVGLLVQGLIAFGSVVGRRPHFLVERTRHYLNLFGAVVGSTAKARKGTSWDRLRDTYREIDPPWYANRVAAGMSSAEGLIWEVRDSITKTELQRDPKMGQTLVEIEVDRGVEDKRLLVVESEFSSVLKQFERQGNTLSMVMRQAWEHGDIRTMTKNSAARATAAHISIIGHITREELRRYLTSTEAANGLANRFLWCAVRRSKLLPEGGGEPDLRPFYARLGERVAFAREVDELRRDEEARALWRDAYARLGEDRPGLVGSLLARSEAQTIRLACLYALLDGSCIVEAAHLQSALALWDYCQRSVEFLFGHSTGDALADEIMQALRKNKKEGISRVDLFRLFSNHNKKTETDRALALLVRLDRAHCKTEPTQGRPKEIWFYGPAK